MAARTASLGDLAQTTKNDERGYPLIVHSHLPWDGVWQRPQQLLSRFSAEHPVLFVEGPRTEEGLQQGRVALHLASEYPNVVVAQMWMPEERWSDGAWIDAERRRLLEHLLAGPLGMPFAGAVHWYYDPMAVTAFAGYMEERAIVYDCMDQLSQFRGAPPELVSREQQLLAMADVVFAGGPKIHSAKRLKNPNCHSYGCGVDIAHFGKARLDATEIPPDVVDLKGPVLGFFGVVDERVDYDLLAALADAHPDWNLVMIGPAAKVDPAQFPQRANLRWLGRRDYPVLPHYVKAFDVCLMPFAINEATEFINPTKALEYMATGTPVVSTAIEDVVLQFSKVVNIANSHAEFIALCESALDAPDEKRTQRGLRLAQMNSWEAIVERLQEHIGDVLDEAEKAETCAA